jgi:hypothetical protein
MNVQKLNAAVEALAGGVGGGLVATDIFAAADGQSIAGVNPQPKASALFNQVTDYLVRALKGSGFPELGRYYVIELQGNAVVVVIPLGEYRWGMLVDLKKVQLGLLLDVLVPQAIADFEAASNG